ncbi:fatty acid synthase-like [Athalia rosae]|uniref:fatty acid synthase-like n=1 Tax=Athalia rosae TaxID=37344 RepID=UPI002033B468|nr:fatty acid synthase-like [Athalia rosae]
MSGVYKNGEYRNGSGGLLIPKKGDGVVISGIAGRFPESDNVKQFQENLVKGLDLVTADHRRWELDDPEIPKRCGKINNVEKFDSVFFGVHSKQAHIMDPMCRILMEHAYEAIIDAGINPRQLRGTNTGVYIGACFSESEKTWFYDKRQVNGFGITGCSRAMLANRISYWLGSTGPSYSVDTACSSGLYAMDHACKAIRNGECDAAIVGSANLCLHPYVALQFSRLGVLSPDGRSKSFDADADGYARSEAVSVVFLQKAKDAKRIYAHVVNTKVNCDGFTENGITFPSSTMQSTLLEQCYKECGVMPYSLAYVEAHGTGTYVGDPEEVNAIERVFCPGRKTPLKIGSVKSNMGHSEPASGLCSIAKVVTAMESGVLPPNLHYKRPREGVKALHDGRIQVVTEVTPWKGGYVGVNSFGFGGANAHALLKSNPKEKINGGAPNDDLPRLVVISGRTEEAVTTILDDLESRPLDVEYVGLYHSIHVEEIPSHLYRGYTILPAKGLLEKKIRDVQHYSGAKRPVWFVYSGMGSQWAGMGRHLLEIPVFLNAIKKCDAVLRPSGLDIFDILTNQDPKTFDPILHSFVGIAAVQIGLTDILTSIGIVPDNIIGHSVGELGCAYADGCFTAEQMILAAYSRGIVSTETETIKGSMAAVGMGHQELKRLCPSEIEIACHNGPDSSTISGPAEAMKKFITELQAKNIFAKEVACSNIAYHSRYIAAAGPKLLSQLQEIAPNPKMRSAKWLSTSIPRSKWTTSFAQLCSPEYHTNNLLGPVLFQETSELIPNNAITIEIAPHALLQAILRKSLAETVTNIGLTKRGSQNNTITLLKAIGSMYQVGLHPRLSNLYPAIEYPVSRGTPMISPLIKWNHSDDWYVTSYSSQQKIVSGERTVELSAAVGEFEWMMGHVIDGRNLIPATGYLELIWETIGLMRGELYTEVSVVFEDVRFQRATTLPKEGSVELTLMIHKGSGRFEVFEGGATVVTGLIRAVANPSQERIDLEVESDESYCDGLNATRKDVYKELRLRGYQYTGLFCGLDNVSPNGTSGRIAWKNNWVAFMDNMLQMQIIGVDTRGLFVPTRIQQLVIDTKLHSKLLRTMPDGDKAFTIRVDKDLGVIAAGGVRIRGLKASAIARRKPAGEPVLETFQFIEHRDRAQLTLKTITRLAVHIAHENHSGFKVKTVELIKDADQIAPEYLTTPIIQEILGDLPLIQADLSVFAPIGKIPDEALSPAIKISESSKLSSEKDALLVIGHGLLSNGNTEALMQLESSLKRGGFILAREPLKNSGSDILSTAKNQNLDILLEKRTDTELVLLLRKQEKLPEITAIIQVNNNEFEWLPKLQAALKAENEKTSNINTRILLVSQGDFESGLMGLINCLRKETNGEVIQGLLIQDTNAPKFSLSNRLYSDQLKLGLALNVLRSGQVWGSYRFLAMDPPFPVPVYHVRLTQLTRGDLSAMRWVEGKLRPTLESKDIIEVHYSPLNFKDIMMYTGKLTADFADQSRRLAEDVVGFEYSGRDANGRGVMGMLGNGTFSNLILCDRDLMWEVPDNWTLEDAATVPVAYGTAYYALSLCGKMKKGEKVLIHAGSGGVGQAAITIALHAGCEVFTTVGTPEKREFIKKQFPQIDDEHIGNSRDTSFEQWIIRKTRGRGVDIVLNSLAEEKLQASVRCLARRGRFLEIGKFDVTSNNPLGMEAFINEISFQGIYLDTLFSEPSDMKSELVRILDEGVKTGVVKPLVRTVFPMDQVEAAFRYMAAGKHIGKVILEIREQKEKRPRTSLPLAHPRYYCSEDGSYLIHGGLGGFGLELADWLVLRGAKNLVLTSRTGVTNGYQQMRINVWKSYGVKVVVVAGKDASTSEGCRAILEEALALGPVQAIFNLAVVLKDGMCENQTIQSFEESFKPKARTTKQLDELSRRLCPDLKHFVVFSSVSCGRGNAGQTSYGMSNSVMERICEIRSAENLPGLAIEWGAVGDVGLVADMQEDNKEIVIAGTLQQRISSCLQELDRFLQQTCPVVSSMVVAEKALGSAGATNIVDTVINIIGVRDLKSVSMNAPLSELGMDSMMAVEIKQTLEREFEVFLSASDIRALNFTQLVEISENQSAQRHEPKKTIAEIEDLGGVKLLIRTLGMDHISEDICVPLPTKAEAGRGEAFVLPGIEGTHTIFLPLAGKLKCPTTCLQLGTISLKSRTIDEMADHLFALVKERTKNRRDFFITGYSYGSLVAIEIVRRLEAEGRTGRLLLIDGSPEYIKALMGQFFTLDDDDKLQNNLLKAIMDIVSPSDSVELAEKLQNCRTWEDKLVIFTKNVPANKNLNLTPQEQHSICTSIYYRIRAILSYDSTGLSLLRTPITLIKPKIQSIGSMSEDYGLQSLTRGKVEVHYVEGNHVTMLDDDVCASAMNGEPIEDAASRSWNAQSSL